MRRMGIEPRNLQVWLEYVYMHESMMMESMAWRLVLIIDGWMGESGLWI